MSGGSTVRMYGTIMALAEGDTQIWKIAYKL